MVEKKGMVGTRNVRELPGRNSVGRGVVEGRGRFLVAREVIGGVTLDEE